MKIKILIAALCILPGCLPAAEVKTTELSILEALQIALREIPDGKVVSSIEHVQIDETSSIYYAVYDEKIISYQRKELNAEGEYVEATKYRKEDVAVEIASKDTIRIGVLESERLRPRSSSGERRVIPKRRVILD